MPAEPPVKEKKEKGFEPGVGEGIAHPPPMVHAAEAVQKLDEKLEHSTTLPYPFRPRLPAWFVEYYQRSGGDTIPVGKLKPEEEEKWRLLLPEGMTPEQARGQIYESGYLDWSREFEDFAKKEGKVSRLEHARLFDESIRQRIFLQPGHPVNALGRSSEEEEKEYMERTGKTYAELALELFQSERIKVLKENAPLDSPFEGLGYMTVIDPENPKRRRRIDLLPYEDEKFMSVFADPEFDFGAVDDKGKRLLTNHDLLLISQMATNVEEHEFQGEHYSTNLFTDPKVVPDRYKILSREQLPLLKEIAPKQWDKLMHEIVANRLKMPHVGQAGVKTASLWMTLRGAVPFGDKVRSLTKEEEALLSVAHPSHKTSELVGGLASLFYGSKKSFDLYEKYKKAGKAKQGLALMLAAEGGLGAGYAHAAPGYFADLAGKPDSYLLNAAEAASIAGLFQGGFAMFRRLVGQRAALTADEIEGMLDPDLSPERRDELIASANAKLNKAGKPDPEDLVPVPGADVVAVGSPTRLQRSWNWMKRMFGSSRGLPEEWIYWKRAADSAKAEKTMGQMSRELENLKDAFNKTYGRAPSGRDIEELNRALEFGRAEDLVTWPRDMQDMIRTLRNHRQELSKAFKDSVPGLTADLRAAIDYNMNYYITRSYQLHDEGEQWIKRMLPEGGGRPVDPEMRVVYRDAFNFIKKEYGKAMGKEFKKTRHRLPSPKELDQLVHNEIHNFLKKGEGEDFFGLTKVDDADSRIIAGIIKQRKKIPVPIRNLMGEYKNPFLNYQKTIAKMAQHIEASKMYANIRASGLRNGLVFSDEAMRPTVQEVWASEAAHADHFFTEGAMTFKKDVTVMTPGFGEGTVVKVYPHPGRMAEGSTAMAARKVKVQLESTASGEKVFKVFRMDELTVPRARLDGYSVSMPPTAIDGLPLIKQFRDRKAAVKWRNEQWANTPTAQGRPREAAGYTQMPNTPAYGVLAGHWVRSDMAQALREVDELVKMSSDNHAVLSALGQTWMAGVSSVNVSKTVFSHVTQIRNMIGGYWINAANGRFWYKDGGKTMGALWDDLKNLKNEEKAALVDEWRKLGLLGGDIEMRHIDEALKDAGFKKWLDSPPDEEAAAFSRWMQEAVKKGVGKPMKFYGQVDAFFRVSAYQDELARLTKAYKGWEKLPKDWSVDKVMPTGFYGSGQVAPMTLKQYASEVVNNTYQSYDRVPKAVQNLRVAPFGNFVSFHAEMFRTSKNTMKLAWEQLRHDNPAIRAMGRRRMASFMVAGVVGSYAAKESANWVFSKAGGFEMNNEKEQAMAHFFPEFQRNNEFVVTALGEGKFEYYDVTYNNPYSFVNKPARAAFLAGKWEDRGYSDVLDELIGPAGDQKILLKALREAGTGKDELQRRIWQETDSDFQKSAKGLAHVAKTLPPVGAGSVQSIQRLVEVAQKKRDGSVPHELFAQVLGMRHYSVNLMDPKKSPLKHKASQYLEYKADASSIFRAALIKSASLNNQVIPVEDQIAAWKAANKRLFEGQKRLYESIQAAEVLGLGRDQIFAALNSDSSQKRVGTAEYYGGGHADEGLIDGYFMPYTPDFGSLIKRAELRGTTIAESELINLIQKYKEAELTLGEGWTDKPLPRDKRR